MNKDDDVKKWQTIASIFAILFLIVLLTRCRWCAVIEPPTETVGATITGLG